MSEVRPDRAEATDRRSMRRQQTRAEIIAAAWELVRRNGVAGLAMRELAHEVGMKAPSLYSYFASKHEIYDAMFHEGYLAFIAAMDATTADHGGAPRERACCAAHQFFEFCTSDPARYQLLFQRTIPDFEPSEASYAVARDALASLARHLAELGVTDPDAVDLWTAVLTGLTDQQISNDPGGDRWERLIDRSVDMLLRDTAT